jgi:hypothetical protein
MAILLIIALAVSIPLLVSPSPGNSYPAEISGHVIIAEKMRCNTAIAIPPDKGEIFWIVDISVKNRAYGSPVEADFQKFYKGWVITANGKTYNRVVCGLHDENPPISLTVGQKGRFMLYFEMPRTLQVDNARICYQGQEPYSYGKLSLVDKVAAYDWHRKKSY